MALCAIIFIHLWPCMGEAIELYEIQSLEDLLVNISLSWESQEGVKIISDYNGQQRFDDCSRLI